MRDIYRVRYKRGDVELDIESSDKDYIDKKLTEIQSSSAEVPAEATRSQRRGRGKKSPTTAASQGQAGSGQIDDSLLAQIIASINDADDYEAIGKRVLDRSDRTARILMCYYFAHRHSSDPALTTGEIERVTSQLGVKIAKANVAKVIRQVAGKYLTADRVRRQGLPVRYQINRRGIAAFEEIIADGKQDNK